MKELVQVYGAARCLKSLFYIDWLTKRKVPFTFYDVEENNLFAAALRKLYKSGKLNFPTILVKDKKLRNPREHDLEKWLIKKGIL